MTTERLYEFLVLSQTLNYSKAAPVLYISQSVLTKHIKEMEKEMGVPLFERNTHGVVLTSAGLLLSREANAIIDSCNYALNTLKLHDLPVRGTIRIGCTLELSYASHIQIFVQEFAEKYPDMEVRTDILTTWDPDQNTNAYDILLTPFEMQNSPSNIRGKLVQTHGTYAVVYPGHRLLSKSLLQMHDLEGETIIVPFMQERFGPYAKNCSLIRKHTHDRVNCIPAKDLPSALFQVATRKGISIIPRYVKNMLPTNSFIIGISNPECVFNEYIYYKETAENGAAKLFYETFTERSY
jgi:DNA-binding transcriptional LysR family regulator